MEVAVYDSDAVFAAVEPERAVAVVREAFVNHARGEWEMPAKVYVEAPPNGDFRAMPARGAGLATLKWVTSFPGNPSRGLPVVIGALLVSNAETGELLAIADCAAITALRTGAAAAVSAQALARAEAETAAVIGCGVNGAWAARCLAAIGYTDGVCADLDAAAAGRLADELGWRAGSREEALESDVVVTVTPGDRPVVLAADLHPGMQLAVLGADAHGKSEVEPAVFERKLAKLFCDEWDQASRGGELAAPVAARMVGRGEVVQLGHVLSGDAAGRTSPEQITLFDSTGLAIQDLAIARAVLNGERASTISL